jgi:hypothetical protein
MTDMEQDLYIANARIAVLEAELDRLKEANRWIPVTEGLPEEHDPTIKMHKESHMEFCTVLAVGLFRGCECGNPAVYIANRMRLKKTGINYIDSEIKTEDWVWSAPFQSVTHWRPLPEPPKEDL